MVKWGVAATAVLDWSNARCCRQRTQVAASRAPEVPPVRVALESRRDHCETDLSAVQPPVISMQAGRARGAHAATRSLVPGLSGQGTPVSPREPFSRFRRFGVVFESLRGLGLSFVPAAPERRR